MDWLFFICSFIALVFFCFVSLLQSFFFPSRRSIPQTLAGLNFAEMLSLSNQHPVAWLGLLLAAGALYVSCPRDEMKTRDGRFG